MDGYWVRFSNTGEVRSLYKVVDGEILGYDFKKKEFTECERVPALGYDAEFDKISDSEGERIYKELKKSRKVIKAVD